MCMEQYPRPNKKQKYYCRRDLLIEKIVNHKGDTIFYDFFKRIDL